MKKNFLLILTSILVVLLISCNRNQTNSRQTSYPREDERVVPVLVQRTVKRDLPEHITISGKLEGFVEIDFISETSGTVTHLYKSLGEWVNKNEEIGKVDNEVYRIQKAQAESALLSAEASFNSASLVFQSNSNLYELDKISELEFKQSKFSFQNSKALLEGARANLEMAENRYKKSKFVSPVSGYLSNFDLRVGKFVSPGMIIGKIVDNEKMIIRTGVGEALVGKVEIDQEVTIRHRDRKFIGKITAKGFNTKGTASLYPLEITLCNSEKMLYSGMVVAIDIIYSTLQNALFFERSSIREEYGKSYVFVINNDNRAELREVSVDKVVDNYVVISQGINIDEMVVIQGIDDLEDGIRVTTRN